MATERPPPSPRLAPRQDSLYYDAHDPSTSDTAQDVAEQDMERAAQSALGLSLFGQPPSALSPRSSPRSPTFPSPSRSPCSPLVQQFPSAVLGPDERASGAAEREDEVDISILVRHGATRQQARTWIQEDRERLGREALRSKPPNSTTPSLTSSPDSYFQSDYSSAAHQLSSIESLPLLPPFPTPALDTDDPYAPTNKPQAYDHMKTLEALEQSQIWRHGSAPRVEGSVAEGGFLETDTAFRAAAPGTVRLLWEDQHNKNGKLQRWLIEELVRERDSERVEAARQAGRALGEETRRLWRHLDRSQMEAGPLVVNGYNLSLAARFRDLQSPPPLSPPSQWHTQSADLLPSRHLPRSDSNTEILDTIEGQSEYRADTPLPPAPRQANVNVYQPPDTETPFTSAVREKPYQTFDSKFLPTAGGGDTTWTKETGKVLDLGGRPTLYRDRIGMANWGRTLLSPIESESELTATASIHSRLTSPSLSYISSTSTATSPAPRRPSDPLSAAAIERARLPTVSSSTSYRARRGGTSSTSLTARVLDSLTNGGSEAGASSETVEQWRQNERRRRKKAEEEHDRAMAITGGLDTLTFVKNTMLEEFGIDLTEEDGPTPPYQEREEGSSAGRPSSSRVGEGVLSDRSGSSRFLSDLVPKELIPLLRQYVRLREGDLKQVNSKPSRLPDEYRRPERFPSTRTDVYSAQVEASFRLNPTDLAITSIDPSSTPPSSPPAAYPEPSPSPRSRRSANDDGQRRKPFSNTVKSASPPDIFSDETPEDSETFTLAPLAPSAGEPTPPPRGGRLPDPPRTSSARPHTSRRPGNDLSDSASHEKARRKATRRAGNESDPAPARHARRDSVFASLVELNKEKSRLHALLPRDPVDYSTAHVPTLNDLAQLIINAKDLRSPEMYDEAAMYYQQSLRLEPDQPDVAFFVGKWNAYKADSDNTYSAHYQQQALECFLTATRLEPKNPRYHMELARAYVNQEIPLDTDETKEMLAIRALRAAIDYAPLASDTRIVAFYRMHFTWRMLARSAEDGDPAKLEIYRLALQAIKACGNEYNLRELAPENERPPSTGEVLPPPALIRKSERTIREEYEDYRLIAEAMMEESMNPDTPPLPPLRRATEPVPASACMTDPVEEDDHSPRPFSPIRQHESRPSPKSRHSDSQPPVFSPTQQDLDNGTPPRSKTAPPPDRSRQDPSSILIQREELHQGVQERQDSPRSRRPSSSGPPRTRNVGIQVVRPRSLSLSGSKEAGGHPHMRSGPPAEPFERATDLIDDGILKLQSILALSQQRQSKRIAAEATEVHQSLAKLQEELIAAVNERNVQAAALTRSLQEVLKELSGLPQRIHASAKLSQLRHESAHPVPPSTNPISFTIAKLRKAKEASKAMRRK